MMRIVIFRNAKDELVLQEERLSKLPPGNGDQRRKALRNGWQPGWIKCGQPTALDQTTFGQLELLPALGLLPEPPEIAPALEIAVIAPHWVELQRRADSIAAERENYNFCLESGLL